MALGKVSGHTIQWISAVNTLEAEGPSAPGALSTLIVSYALIFRKRSAPAPGFSPDLGTHARSPRVQLASPGPRLLGPGSSRSRQQRAASASQLQAPGQRDTRSLPPRELGGEDRDAPHRPPHLHLPVPSGCAGNEIVRRAPRGWEGGWSFAPGSSRCCLRNSAPQQQPWHLHGSPQPRRRALAPAPPWRASSHWDDVKLQRLPSLWGWASHSLCDRHARGPIKGKIAALGENVAD